MEALKKKAAPCVAAMTIEAWTPASATGAIATVADILLYVTKKGDHSRPRHLPQPAGPHPAASLTVYLS